MRAIFTIMATLLGIGMACESCGVGVEKKAPGKKSDPPWVVRPLRMVESKPVIVNDAEFVAVTESEWKYEKPVNDVVPIEIRLRISNLKKVDVAFPTFVTFQLAIKTAAGKEIPAGGGSDVTIASRPIIIAPGRTFSICREAQMSWNRKRGSGALTYFDGTGMQWCFENLRPGRYQLSFAYSTKQAPSQFLVDKMKSTPVWSGEAATQEVPFEIVAP